MDFCWFLLVHFIIRAIIEARKDEIREEDREKKERKRNILCCFIFVVVCFYIFEKYGCADLKPLKESNELSGSRGEANFVWRCKSCKVCRIFL